MIEPISEEDEWNDGRTGQADDATITSLVHQFQAVSADVARLETELKDAKDLARRIREVQLPDAMLAANRLSITLLDGTVIGIQMQVLNWGIPKGKEDEALAFVRRTGHGDIIKHVVVATLDRGDDELARRIVQGIRSGPGGNRVFIEDKASIHHQTLGKYLRDRLAEYAQVPEELFGMYRRNVATVTLPSKKEASF